MMKKYIKQYVTMLAAFLVSFFAVAQTDTTMVMDPGTFELDPSGYYLAGVDKQIDDCGQSELHFGGCDDAYGDSDHDEFGTQFGWQYGEAIIFHECNGEGVNQEQTCVGSADKYHESHPEGWDTSEDFLRLGKHKYFDTDSSHFGYLITPPFTNLKSITISATGDISRQEGNRELVYVIEASTNGGQTWDFVDITGEAYLEHTLLDHAGDVATYTDGGGDANFQKIVDLSKEADSTMLRILPIPYLDNIERHKDGQRLNIYEVTIEAQTVPEQTTGGGGGGGTVLASDAQKDFFTIRRGELISTSKSELTVYNLSGSLIGKGSAVALPCNGLYVIRNQEGKSRKIFLKD